MHHKLTRRKVLQHGLAALASVGSLGAATKTIAHPSLQTVKLGIAGEAVCYHSKKIAEAVQNDAEACGNVQLAGVWDRDIADAEQLAKRFGIPLVAESAEELADAVDGVMILGGERAWEGRSFTQTRDRSVMGSMVHHRYAPAFLKAKIPTYIDKPLAASCAEAKPVVDLATSCGAPMFSCSPRRFADAVVNLQATLERQVGEIFGGMTCGGLNFSDARFYGIHHLDVLLAVLGHDITAVHEIGDARHRVCRLRYRAGFSVIFDAAFGRPVQTRLFLYGKKGTATIPVAPPNFTGLAAAVAQMVRTGKPAVTAETMLRRVKIFDAMDRSLAEGKEIEIA